MPTVAPQNLMGKSGRLLRGEERRQFTHRKEAQIGEFPFPSMGVCRRARRLLRRPHLRLFHLALREFKKIIIIIIQKKKKRVGLKRKIK
jgi:hypothetical protein